MGMRLELELELMIRQIRRLHYENEDIVSFAILPGHVVT